MRNFNNIKRLFGAAALIAAILVAVTVLLRLQKETAPKLSVRKLPLQVDISLEKFHYTETKQGVKKWELSAERAEYNKKTDVTSLTGVKLMVAGGAKTGNLTITADRAEYHNGTRNVVLSGNVKGASEKGFDFSTPRVSYVAARSQLETEERVRFADAGSELEGVGMVFHTQTRRFKLKKDVSAVYRQRRDGR